MSLNGIERRKSKIFVLTGNIADYDKAYQTKIIIKDLALIPSEIFGRITVGIENIKSNFGEIKKKEENVSEERIERLTSVIVILVYVGLLFLLILFYFLKLLFSKII